MLPDLFLLPDERDNPHTRIDAHHPEGVAWSVGNHVRPLVHGRPYFAELHERVSAMGQGDSLFFVDWRGDPDERLTDDPAETVSATFSAAARRGVDVRGLLWRSHWSRFGFHSEKSRVLGIEIDEAGGQCLRDMRVRTAGSHHQKFVVLRHADDPRATSPSSAGSTSATPVATTSRTRATRRSSRCHRSSDVGRRGTTCTSPSRGLRSSTSRRCSASAGRTRRP